MRNCCSVIEEMIKFIPKEEEDLIRALSWNYEDSLYKAPEETIQWERTSDTLVRYIGTPNINKSWQIKILSIFSTIPEEEIIKELKNV